ncbi:MAG: outer membrane lipoprotein-sorting protein [bacterium]
MKKVLSSVFAVSLFVSGSVLAIDVDEIFAGAIENTGGADAWSKLNGIKMTGEFNQGGQKFPFEIVNLRDGRQYLTFSFQGKEIKQGVFDGETVWNTNFMTMKAEKADAETTANRMLDKNDFPSAFFNYKEKGYSAELVGTETVDGTETYKVKLVKEPITVDGKKIDDISFIYFDSEALVPLVQESEIHSGPGKGKVGESKLGDYQEVDGLYFPFSMTQGIKGGGSATMVITKVELNPTVDDAVFAFPEQTEPEAESKKAE